jgi:hypothetical protein
MFPLSLPSSSQALTANAMTTHAQPYGSDSMTLAPGTKVLPTAVLMDLS